METKGKLYYLDAKVLIDFQYEEELFDAGYIKPGEGLKANLADYQHFQSNQQRGIPHKTLDDALDKTALDMILGEDDEKGKNEYDYIREIKDYCLINDIYLRSSYLAYYDYLKHCEVTEQIEKLIKDIPFKLVEGRILRRYSEYNFRDYKYVREKGTLSFSIPEPLEQAFKWHQKATGMGVIDKVEKETVDFQDMTFYRFMTPLLQLGFSLIDALHLRICGINGIANFCSKDKQFGYYADFIKDEHGLAIIPTYKRLFESLKSMQ